MIENSVGPAIKAVDLDVDSFSFAKTESSDKSSDGRSHESLPSSDFPADFLFANGQLLPHAFPVASNSSRRSICKDMLLTTSRKSESNATTTTRSSSTTPRRRCSKSADGEKVVEWPAKPKHVRFRSRDDVVPPPKWLASPELVSSTTVDEVDSLEKKRAPAKKQMRRDPSAGRGFFQSFFAVCRQCRETPQPGKKPPRHGRRRLAMNPSPSSRGW